MENREIPIFHKFPGLRPQIPKMGSKSFLFGGTSPPNKKFFLRVLGASAVKILFCTSMNFNTIFLIK